jgi:paraquat-inducible protein B
VFVGAWLAAKAVLDRGPMIAISFKTAEGLEPGKTRLKFKEVDVGLVKTIKVSPDRTRVVVTAEMRKDAEDFLVEDTRFWTVRPRLGASEVSGLGTLLSGAYIALDPGRSTEGRREFVALDTPPIVTQSAPGREFVLKAESSGAQDVGAPVFFRRVAVGEVSGVELDKDGKGVAIRIFIHAPYDQYVTTSTRFWNASGIDIALDADGIRVQTQSIVSILVGGIAFQARPDAEVARPAEAKTVFHLFASREDAMRRPDLDSQQFVLVFRQSLRGLALGSIVDFRGIPIGEVTRIGLEFDSALGDFVQPVDINVYPDRLRIRSRNGNEAMPVPKNAQERAKRAQYLVERGLRAQLRTGNLLTNQLYVAIDFYPNAPKVKFDSSKTPFEIPVIPGSLDDLQATLSNVASKLDRIPYEQIAADLQKALASMDATLHEAEGLIKRLDGESVAQLNRTLHETQATMKAVQDAVASESPLQTDLRESIRELARAAAALRRLADHLQRQPQSVIRGKPEEETTP